MNRRLAFFGWCLCSLFGTLGAGEGGNAAGPELLANGGFEGGLASWQVPDWIDGLLPPRPDETVQYGGGTRSVRFDGDGNRRALLYQTVHPGRDVKRLRLRGALRIQGFENMWTARLALALARPLPGGQGVDEHLVAFNTDWRKTDEEWLPVSLEADVPADCLYVRVYLATVPPDLPAPDNRGTAWFDQLSLTAIPVGDHRKGSP